MKKTTIQLNLIGAVVLAVGSLLPVFAEEDVQSESPITLQVGQLTAVFADNTAFGDQHRARYNGIAELHHASASGNLFVPLYAGFNLEHFFGGDYLEELFEPREHPMTLSQLDDHTVQLHQPPPPRSKVETTTTFRMAGPYYIDVDVEIVFHDLSQFRHGYAGLFYASYINAPEDKAIHFWGISEDDSNPRWITAYSPEHGVESTHTYVDDAYEPYYVENFNTTLANHYSKYHYIEPFYYGLRGDMVFAIMFDRTEGIRFSQSPTGGGEKNPAWDFHVLIPDPEIGKTYSFKSRLVYKEFVSAEDIRDEYVNWTP
ncbi:MAG: hypothetical protein KC931_08630 [Candidatus Omnitrophica bacterium]|nr:hypothetical protein [Candidatus Omnitrophota bacterium]